MRNSSGIRWQSKVGKLPQQIMIAVKKEAASVVDTGGGYVYGPVFLIEGFTFPTAGAGISSHEHQRIRRIHG